MSSKHKKPGMPTPAERPDLYDGYDFGQGSVLSKQYSDSICPPHIKEMIEARARKAKATKS